MQKEIRPAKESKTGTSLWQRLAFHLLMKSGRRLAGLFRAANGSAIHPSLDIEHWEAIGGAGHNAFTDLARWRGDYYLIHASSPWHLASDQCRLVLRRSHDARTWEEIAEFRVPGEDIRDPKLAVIDDRLFLYVLKNDGFAAEPYGTAWAASDDGVTWSPLKDIDAKGWLFWRPKTQDGKNWFVPAYWHHHGKSVLLKSTDGVHWTTVSTIYEGDFNDETDIEFLPDGRLVATARLEMSANLLGHRKAGTLIAISDAPYTSWTRARCSETRLDGPCLFAHEGKVFAVGRRHAGRRHFPFHLGSILGAKRTAIYRVDRDRLVHLSDLPSQGDTSYAGIVQEGTLAHISYYSNAIDKDYPWILGMLTPTHVRMAKVDLASLTRCETERTSAYADS